MSSMENIESTLKEKIIEGYCQEFGGVKSGGYIQDIECIECKETSAFTYLEKPYKTYCNKLNNCGEKASYEKYFPDLKKAHLEKSGENDPHLEAKKYAYFERGLKNFESFGGQYDEAFIEGKRYASLSFLLSDGATKNHRVISGPRKTHNTGAVKGLVWLPKTEIDFAKPIHIAEAPIKAMGLLEAGHQAVAVTSANAKPEGSAWVYENLEKFSELVLAFDNDQAGHDATKRWAEFCTEHEIKFSVALPFKGDWDDLWKAGKLTEKGYKKCVYEGSAYMAKSALEAAQKRYELLGFVPRIFEWKGRTYSVAMAKATVDNVEVWKVGAAFEIIRGTLKGAFSVQREGSFTCEEKPVQENFLRIQNEDGTGSLVLVTAKNLSSPTLLHEFLLETARVGFYGDKDELKEIINKSVDIKKLPLVRAPERFGYEEKTDAFVFKQLAIDAGGRVILPNQFGYFPSLNILPPLNYSAKAVAYPFPKVNSGEFLLNLWKAYRERGLLALGYYVSTYFAKIHFEAHGFHPFLSVFGPRGGGKSNLIKKLNETFTFIDCEGVPFSRASTMKGLVRAMADRVNLPICFLEGNETARLSFDEQDLLALYNRNSSQTTARKTMDISTRSVPFEAGLVFVQMREPFKDAGVKQRFVSVEFPEKENKFTDEEKEGFTWLRETTTCDVGVQTLQKRVAIQSEWLGEIAKHKAWISTQGIDQERVSGNYAVILAGLCLFAKHVANVPEERLEASKRFLVLGAEKKAQDSLKDENVIADAFFDAFEKLREEGEFIERGIHYIEHEGLLCIRLTEVLAVMARLNYGFGRSTEDVTNALKRHQEFRGRSRVSAKGIWKTENYQFRCWRFETKTQLEDRVENRETRGELLNFPARS